jgi:ribulose-5-phosphate 4-epimerase/fuculose-1-phosphate aldolase
MSDRILPRPTALIDDLVTATQVLIDQSVLDVFGHVALRDPHAAGVFWMGTAGAPARIGPDDVLPFDVDANPLVQSDAALFSERYLHAALFKARTDMHASCHYHAEALMPYCLGARTLCASNQTGGWMGARVPLWDSQHRFGDTAMLVSSMDQSQDLMAAMGEGTLVLLRGHGVLVAGTSLRDMTFRAVHSCREARCDTLACGLGGATMLSAGEIALCQSIAPAAIARARDHWTALLAPQSYTITTTKGRVQ